MIKELKGKKLLFICILGARSGSAADRAISLGYDADAVNIWATDESMMEQVEKSEAIFVLGIRPALSFLKRFAPDISEKPIFWIDPLANKVGDYLEDNRLFEKCLKNAMKENLRDPRLRKAVIKKCLEQQRRSTPNS